ncbi:DUF2909 domain-containing protein [Teredinibacter purpureus]|uniref:DUF2909 domain-containing protein n=1 Tax=Teredinibacter purpureus TaxID=2731756 RepID=UPI0005F8955C|nr:DUF2909 domain-containing protein [Teredinibacter purpureus]
MSLLALKITIIILFIAVVGSLSSGLVFLMKDMGVAESKRALIALGVRIILAAALLLTIGYGIYSGKLSNTAPWGNHRQAASQE